MHAQPQGHAADAIKCATAAQAMHQSDQGGARAPLASLAAPAVVLGPADPHADTHPADDGSGPAAPGAAAALELQEALQGVPAELRVSANSNAGLYLVERRAVKCMCASCVEVRLDPRCEGYVVSPTEFERHSGIPSAKKWRFSIKVTHGGEPAVSLGRWLELKGLDQKLPKRGHMAGRTSPSTALARARAQQVVAEAQQQQQQQQQGLLPAAAAAADQRQPHGARDAPAQRGDAARRLAIELSSGRADGVVQLTRVVSPGKRPDEADKGASEVSEEPPALAAGAAAAPAAAAAAAADALEDAVVAEAPTAPQLPWQGPLPQQQAQQPGRPPRLHVPGEPDGGAAAVPCGGGGEAGGLPADDDSQWMQSPRRLRATPRGPGPSGGAAAAGAEGTPVAAAAAAAAAGAKEGAAEAAAATAAGGEGEADEEEEIRVGPEFQAALPPWRPRPVLRGAGPAAQAAAAALAADLARVGQRGPTEAQAMLLVLQDKARADLLPPDATDDLWEMREPALALERGQRQRRAPGWMQGEQYVHQMAGGAAAGQHGKGGGDDDEDGNSSDHQGSARRGGRKRAGSNGAQNGTPPPRGSAAAQQQQEQALQLHHHHQLAAQHQQHAAAAAAALQHHNHQQQQHARSGLSSASGGAAQLHQALAAAASQPGAPHLIEWRTQEGLQAMEVALVLGGQVYVGRLCSRGPIVSWLPPAVLQQAQAAAGPPGPALAPAAAAPAKAQAQARAAAAVAPQPLQQQQARLPVKEEATAATPCFERASSAEHPQRRCTLCGDGADGGLGPFMPVQIQNGQLEWVHRDCALWSPEVSVDAAGRLLSLAAAVRRGFETTCTHCGRRGATLPCWRNKACGHELHLPCARKMGCHFSEGGDARLGGGRAVACPAHGPGSQGVDPEAERTELPAHGGAGGGGGAAAEEMVAAELLTGFKRGSMPGDGSGAAGETTDPQPGAALRRRAAAAAAAAAAQQPRASGKRRRSGSDDGSALAGSHGGLASDDEDAAGAHGPDAAKRRACADSSAAGSGAATPGLPDGPTGAAAAGLLHRLQQLAAAGGGGSDGGDPACPPVHVGGAQGGGAGLLQHLQPAALLMPAGAGHFAGLLGAHGAGAAAAAALGGTTGQAGRPGRCAVCVIQRKGKCGTDSAPKKCMRRQQAQLESELLQQKLRQQLAAQQDQLLMEQLQLAARQEAQQMQQMQQAHQMQCTQQLQQ